MAMVGMVATPSGGQGGSKRRQLTEEMVFMRTKCNRMDLIRNLNLWGNDLHNIGILRLMPNLEVLSLSVNQVSSLAALHGCPKLSELYLRKNNIYDLAEVQHLASCPQLRVLWLNDNPCATLQHYREYVLHHLPCLTKVDSQDVTEEERRRAAGIDARDMQTSVGAPPCDLGDEGDFSGGASPMWELPREPARYSRTDSMGQARVFDERPPEPEAAQRSISLQEPAGGVALRGSQESQSLRQSAVYGNAGNSHPSERVPHQQVQQASRYAESPEQTPTGSREPSEQRIEQDCRARPNSYHNGTNIGGRQRQDPRQEPRQDPRDAWAENPETSPVPSNYRGHFDEEELEHRRQDRGLSRRAEEPERRSQDRGLSRRAEEQHAAWSGNPGRREDFQDYRGGREMRHDARSDIRSDGGGGPPCGLHGRQAQWDHEMRDDTRRQPVFSSGGLGIRGHPEALPGVPAGGANASGMGQDASSARGDNILCAVLALIKELDGQGLELVHRAIEQRQGEL